ncbi:MAG: deoxyribose-phosphate aldolase, partial [Peptostreptococcaceae bacterium]
PKDIIKICDEAREYDFYAVCVNGCYVKLSKQELEGTNVKVCAVIGFPLGAMDTESKIFEAKQCIKNGASEIDMVINVGMLKAGEFQYVED